MSRTSNSTSTHPLASGRGRSGTCGSRPRNRQDAAGPGRSRRSVEPEREHASGNAVTVGQEQQQQQLPQAARPNTKVLAVCALRELPRRYKQRTGTTRLFSQLPTVGIELFVLLPAPGVEAWTKAAKQTKKWRHRY